MREKNNLFNGNEYFYFVITFFFMVLVLIDKIKYF
jgi:hypothetical protein